MKGTSRESTDTCIRKVTTIIDLFIVYAQSILIAPYRQAGGKEEYMGRLKLFENILRIAAAVISVAMSIVRFIGSIGKLKTADA